MRKCAFDKERDCDNGCIAYLELDTPEGIMGHCSRMGKNFSIQKR